MGEADAPQAGGGNGAAWAHDIKVFPTLQGGTPSRPGGHRHAAARPINLTLASPPRPH